MANAENTNGKVNAANPGTVDKESKKVTTKGVVQKEFIKTSDLTTDYIKKNFNNMVVIFRQRESKAGRKFASINLSIHDIYMNDLDVNFKSIHEFNLFRKKLGLDVYEKDDKGNLTDVLCKENRVYAYYRWVKGQATNKTTGEDYEYMALELIFKPGVSKMHFFAKEQKGLIMDLIQDEDIKVVWEYAPEKLGDVEAEAVSLI